ncbi:signal peptidase II [Cumulibacter manganitolerans]|uniref:signal peptidase II n=1 Tax=Cumulibacter manganitolerans TaxID=1884992 RepID=UPI001297CF2F|nr:signal peptidase II [Cumulibacter manganitolerans]
MTARRWTRPRIALALSVALLITLDLSVKAWAAQALAGGGTVGLHVIDLRLVFNSGMAFGLGDILPAWVILALTGLVTAGLAVLIWRTANSATLPVRIGLAAVLSGASANLLDRAADGAVTDYLHTGWFPTFNLADVFITTGAAALVMALWRSTEPPGATESGLRE